jgi:2,3-bisphosphoglycerate-independent phosphoglycerate mutase
MADESRKPHVLMILDGWGLAPAGSTNAVSLANTPCLDRLMTTYPSTQLLCTGEAVGLPDGIMGNSEVGHLNIGAGRIVCQVLLRIDRAIREGTLHENEALSGVMAAVSREKSGLHLLGLVSDGGVHSQLSHLYALVDMAAAKGLPDVYIHVILDGRDTSPDAGVRYVAQLQRFLTAKGFGRIASICGRYYAMDRDTRWDRTEKAYRLYTMGEGIQERDPIKAVEHAYERGETDEFVKPIIMVDDAGKPVKMVSHQDGLISFNFRPDRVRQITRAFTDQGFDHFLREKTPILSGYVTMTVYDETFTLPVAFGPVRLENIFGEIVSRQGLRQLRIAETEKYAHVTYFFNGGEEKAFPGEDRHLVPSPREVSTYDKKPEMSAYEVAQNAVSYIESGKYDLIVMNFANLDMVGHTGVIAAAIAAGEAVDQCVEKVVFAVQKAGGLACITADHGNAEQMKDENGQIFTAHSMNPVPFILVSDRQNIKLRSGVLGDIAPTMLALMGIKKPAEMTCASLIQGSISNGIG